MLPPTAVKKDPYKERSQSLAEYMEQWLASLNPERMSNATRHQYAGFIKNHITPALGDVPLTLLSKEHMEEFFYRTLPNKPVSKKNPSRTLGTGVIRNIWKPLSMALKQAEADGLILDDPLRRVERPRDDMKEVRLDTSLPLKLLRALEGQRD